MGEMFFFLWPDRTVRIQIQIETTFFSEREPKTGVTPPVDGSCQGYLKLFTWETRKSEGLITDDITVSAYVCGRTHIWSLLTHFGAHMLSS